MEVYFVVYLLLMWLGVFYYDKPAKLYLIPLGIFLTLFAGLRGSLVSSDYSTYAEYFELVTHTNNIAELTFIEPSFVLFSRLFFNVRGVILVYALLSIAFKLKAFEKITPFIYYSIALWISHFFLVLELNQIRAGLAISILLCGFPYIVDRKLIKFLVIVFVATLVHYSAIIYLPFYFLNTKKVTPFYFVIIPLSYILNALGFGLIEILSRIPLSVIQDKIEAYNLLFSLGSFTKINVYNPIVLLRVGFIYIFLFNWKFLAEKNAYFVILLKAYVIAIVCMLLFARLPVFGLRLSDLFGMVEIVLLPFFFYLFKEKYLVLLFLLIFGLLIMSIDLYYNSYLGPYTL
jgi:hypothetical protein